MGCRWERTLEETCPGWTVQDRGGKHLRLVRPGKPAITVPRTPSDKRALLNIRAMVRRFDREPG